MFQQITIDGLSDAKTPKRKRKSLSSLKKDSSVKTHTFPAVQTYMEALENRAVLPKLENDLMEVNSPTLLKEYGPLERWRFMKLFDREKGADFFDTAQKVFLNNYKIRRDSVVLIPAYITRSHWEEKYDTTAVKKHTKFYRNVVNLLEDDEGYHPRILCPKDTSEKPRFVFNKLKSNDKQEIAGNFNSWLANHPEITKIFISDLEVARKIFPEIRFASSFSASAYMVYKTKIDSRVVTIMLLPTPVQIDDQEDKGYVFMSEILSVPKNYKEMPKVETIEIATLKDLQDTLSKLQLGGCKLLALDLETSGLNPRYYNQSILSCAFSDGVKGYSFLVDHPNYPSEEGVEMLRYLWSYEGIPNFVLQNAVYDVKWCLHFYGIFPKARLLDTMLIDHWLWEGGGALNAQLKTHSFSMAKQIIRHLGYNSHKDMIADYTENAEKRNDIKFPKAADITVKEIREWVEVVRDPKFVEPRSGAYIAIPRKELLQYNAMDTWMTYHIYKKQMVKVIKEVGGRKFIPETLKAIHPGQIKAIAEMEMTGAPLDYDAVLENIVKAQKVIATATDSLESIIDIPKWEKINKGKFNLSSGQQLLEYLFKHEKIKKNSKGFTSPLWDEEEGRYTAGSKFLQKLVPEHPWLVEYIKFAKASKARNTYLVPFIFHSYNGNLFFHLDITGTATGRLSSRNPNLQNLPVNFLGKTSDCIEIKSCIRAPEGYGFADFDYATLEVKVMCAKDYCPDENLINAINNGDDVHCLTASKVFDMDYNLLLQAKKDADAGKKITDEQVLLLEARQAAKASIFGTVYGSGPHKFSKNLRRQPGETDEQILERATIILNTLKTVAYPKLLEMFDNNDRTLLEKGFAQTILGRRRRFHKTLPRKAYLVFEKANLIPELKEIEGLKFLAGGGREFRQLGNFLVQSTGSDIVQLFIIDFMKRRDPDFDIKLVAQVHDSLIFYYKDKPGAKDYINELLEISSEQYISAKLGDKLPVRIGHACDFGRGYHLGFEN